MTPSLQQSNGSSTPKNTFEERRSSIRGALLGVISALGTATQLRAAGAIGVAEIALVTFVLITWTSSRGKRPNVWSSRVCRFLLLFSIGLTVGALVASTIFSASLFGMFAGLAVPYFLLLVVIYVMRQDNCGLLLRYWARAFAGLFLGSQLMLLLLALQGRVAGFIDPMYFGVRFQGWTSNPNQLAFMTVLAATALTHAGRVSKLVKTTGVAAALLLGLASMSDGFRLAFLVSIAAVLFVSISDLRGENSLGVRFFAWTAVFTLLLLIVAMWSTLVDKAAAIASAGNQGSDRLRLWGLCLRTFVQSPITGLGPGSHAVDSKFGYLMECHNSLLDVASSAGVIVAIALVLLFTRLFQSAWKSVDYLTIAGLAQIAVMTSFGYLLRYPQLWLLLLVIESHQQEKAKDCPKDHNERVNRQDGEKNWTRLRRA